MKLFSPAFQEKMPIPKKYSCKGEDISIPLNWEGVPSGTQSLAVIMDDPDAPSGTWVHWIIYNIPATSTGLAENQPKEAKLPDGSLQGINDGKFIGYMGPCPPSGTHRYFVKLYALDCVPAHTAGLNVNELNQFIRGHILEKTEFYGTCQH